MTKLTLFGVDICGSIIIFAILFDATFRQTHEGCRFNPKNELENNGT